jgi:DNA-nicking Smr family endonuclease
VAKSFKDQLKAWGTKEAAPAPSPRPTRPPPPPAPPALTAPTESLSDEELFQKAFDGVQGPDAILAKYDRRDLPASARPSGVAPQLSDEALFLQALGEVRPEDVDKLKGNEESERQQAAARFARRVARGEVEPANTLDLHGDSRSKALSRTKAFLEAEFRARTEVLLVVHGRGTGALAEEVAGLLNEHPAVAEHVAAPLSLGGEGARVVRLRRSDEKKARRR